MATLIFTSLIAFTLLAVVFYRCERDYHLNFKTGHVFRAWVAENMTPVLADDDAPILARRLASALLAAAYDRPGLVILAYASAARRQVRLPSEQLGRYADLIHLGARYVAVLAVLERRSMGAALRKFLSAEPDPLRSAADMPRIEDKGDRASLEYSVEAVEWISHFPRSRAVESAVEESILSAA